MKVLVVTTLLVAAATSENVFRVQSPYSYTCSSSEGACVRKNRQEASEIQSLQQCQITCGQYGALWPQPTGEVRLSKQVVRFSPDNLQVTRLNVVDQEVSRMLEEATNYFRRNVHYLHPDYPTSQKVPYTEDQRQRFQLRDPFTQQSQQQRFTPQSQQQQQQQQQFRQEPLQQQQQQQQQLNEFDNQERSYEAWERYSPFFGQKYSLGVERQRVNIEITVTGNERRLRLDTDEQYNLKVQTSGDETQVNIQAPTYFGARHALETLNQLIAFDENTNSLIIVREANIQDEPQFKYRGFMLDTGRQYYPRQELLRLLDTMSQNKMNYFHWHITDSASFPMYSESRPQMAYYGSYGPRKTYYPEDIREVVDYANRRGINVVPEINAPGHSRSGWEWGEKSGLGSLLLCGGQAEDQKPWYEFSKEPPAGQLNPVNPEVYNVLSDIYKDTLRYFDPEMLHMGGDDVSFKCWQASPEVQNYLKSNNKQSNSQEMFALWNVFQSNAYAKLVESSGEGRKVTPIIHSSSFVRNYLDKNTYVVQVNEFTSDSNIARYVQDGYRVIFSNLDQWRLDCADTTWVGEKSASCPNQIPNWSNFYKNSPLETLDQQGIPNIRNNQQNRDLVLGGTVSLYSSETDSNGLQSKSFPRTSAMAERLWSDPVRDPQGINTTQRRLNLQRQRMVSRGVRADPLQPEYCMHDETACYSREEYEARSANIPAA